MHTSVVFTTVRVLWSTTRIYKDRDSLSEGVACPPPPQLWSVSLVTFVEKNRNRFTTVEAELYVRWLLSLSLLHWVGCVKVSWVLLVTKTQKAEAVDKVQGICIRGYPGREQVSESRVMISMFSPRWWTCWGDWWKIGSTVGESLCIKWNNPRISLGKRRCCGGYRRRGDLKQDEWGLSPGPQDIDGAHWVVVLVWRWQYCRGYSLHPCEQRSVLSWNQVRTRCKSR